MLIRVNSFSGIAPINDAAKLPERNATRALVTKFEGGNLRPYRQSVAPFVNSNPTADIRSMHKIGPNQWVVWTGDVSVARGPVPHSTEQSNTFEDFRFYWAGRVEFDAGAAQYVSATGHSGAQVWPRFTTRFRAMNQDNPATFFERPIVDYPLGVPPPTTTLVVAATGAPTGLFTTIRKGDPAQVECTAPHGLTTGVRVRLTGLPGSGDGSELNNSTFLITLVDTTKFKLDSVDTTAYAADLTGLNATWTREYADSELEDRLYVMTYVNSFGEEGKPGPPSSIVSVGEGQSVTVTLPVGGSIPVANGPTFEMGATGAKRIYRSVSGETTQYLFVAEVALATVSYTDSLGFEDLGEVLSTEDYDLPPQRLAGVVLMEQGGYLLGWVGNELWASEPYLPYAWPEKYKKVLDHKIVGIETFGGYAVVATEGKPVIVSGTDPASLQPVPADVVYPCISRRSMCSNGSSVFYAGPNSLIQCDAAGAREVLLDYWSYEQWRYLIEGSGVAGAGGANGVFCAWHKGKLFLGVHRSEVYILDIGPEGTDIAQALLTASAMATDPVPDTLFYVTSSSNANERRIRTWDAIANEGTSAIATYVWRSKSYQLTRETNFAVAQVLAPAYPSAGWHIMTAKFYADGALKHTQLVTSKRPFKLPGEFTSDEWMIEITSNLEVKAVHLANTVEELKQVAL